MPPAIRVENLGKSYRVGRSASPRGYRTLRESLVDAARIPFQRLRHQDEATPDAEFWALKSVEFEVQPGEVVGIIGRNGAGKSTLLKILSRITKPTTGRVELRGRVGSLLEVGTGFHPELTGRENVFLNGAILGMKRGEIARKFDEIVAFAEVEKFIDTAVKRYSSGMYVRLAFAVTAHLEPEILIVDEVLAVGDALFQRRCLDRMSEMAKDGRTLIFVSHNMDLIPKLCERAILLADGRTLMMGPARDVTDAYLTDIPGSSADESLSSRPRRGDGRARFEKLAIVDEFGNPLNSLRFRKDSRFIVDVRARRAFQKVSLAIVVKSIQGARILTSWTDEVGRAMDLQPGIQQFECRFKDIRIRAGRQVAIELWMSDGELMDSVDVARVLDVFEDEPSGYSFDIDQGPYVCDYSWTKREVSKS